MVKVSSSGLINTTGQSLLNTSSAASARSTLGLGAGTTATTYPVYKQIPLTSGELVAVYSSGSLTTQTYSISSGQDVLTGWEWTYNPNNGSTTTHLIGPIYIKLPFSVTTGYGSQPEFFFKVRVHTSGGINLEITKTNKHKFSSSSGSIEVMNLFALTSNSISLEYNVEWISLQLCMICSSNCSVTIYSGSNSDGYDYHGYVTSTVATTSSGW